MDVISGAGHDAKYVAKCVPGGNDFHPLQGRYQPQRD